eukprot:TRINITY_DN2693_c0_g1_i1.p1 TRINITY_DN2693_c0_g1~~TRINITY_DN2693_c0_g1_i1.p1  ORF type:complete len:334 (+),score=98.09 TRINITY_DN2693_c0_g1_i1:432-1433(+)
MHLKHIDAHSRERIQIHFSLQFFQLCDRPALRSEEIKGEVELAIQVQFVEEKDGKAQFDASTHPDFVVGNNPHGGYLNCLVANACIHFQNAQNSELKDPIHVTTIYFSVSKIGPVRIQVQVIKKGKSSTILHSKMFQGDKTILQSDLIFGNLSKEKGASFPIEIRNKNAAHIMPFRRDREPSPTNLDVQKFVKHMNWWYDHDAQQKGSESYDALSLGWSEFKDKRPLDVLSLLFLADLPRPPIFQMPKSVVPHWGWVPTMTISTQIIKAPTSGATVASARLQTRYLNEGRLEADGEVKEYVEGKGEEVVAISRQMAVFNPVKAMASNPIKSRL